MLIAPALPRPLLAPLVPEVREPAPALPAKEAVPDRSEPIDCAEADNPEADSPVTLAASRPAPSRKPRAPAPAPALLALDCRPANMPPAMSEAALPNAAAAVAVARPAEAEAPEEERIPTNPADEATSAELLVASRKVTLRADLGSPVAVDKTVPAALRPSS